MLGSDRSYNDPKSAELVCSYGRAIVIKMMQCIEAAGGLVLELDTDGIIFSGDYVKIIQYVKDNMPRELEMDVEYHADWIYIDAAKNYIYKIDDRIIKKGIFRKRNQMKLFVEFVESYCKKYLEDPKNANDYYNSVIANVKGGIDVKKIAITRKISKAEKVCLKYGSPGDKITVYRGYDEGRKPTPVIAGPYHVDFYLKEVNKWKKGIDESILNKQELTGNNVEYINTLQKDGTNEYPY
jgi:DNA polymerase elongation subunit (family B)